MVKVATTPQEIEAEFDLLNSIINEACADVVKWFVGDIYSKVIVNAQQAEGTFGSPVLTGRFYNSHRISINGKDTSVAPENKGDTPYGPLDSKIAESKLKPFKMGDKIYITNFLEYAGKLESGYSRKTPSGIYEVSVTASVSFFSERVGTVLDKAMKKRSPGI